MTLLIVFPIVVVVLLFVVSERKVRVSPKWQRWWKGLTSMLEIGPFRRMVYVALAIVIGEASRHALCHESRIGCMVRNGLPVHRFDVASRSRRAAAVR